MHNMDELAGDVAGTSLIPTPRPHETTRDYTSEHIAPVRAVPLALCAFNLDQNVATDRKNISRSDRFHNTDGISCAGSLLEGEVGHGN